MGREVASGLRSQCEAISAEFASHTPSDVVEVDGACCGGHIHSKNRKEDRIDRRKATHQTGKGSVVMPARERGGRALSDVSKTERAFVSIIAARIAPGSTVHADEAAGWDKLHACFLTKHINHSESYSDGEA